MVILDATFGNERHKLDVTDGVRKAAAGGLFVRKNVSWSDPDPGHRKALVVRGTYGGEEFELTATDDAFMEGLTFGKPSGRPSPQ
jgi:hypothetical protein